MNEKKKLYSVAAALVLFGVAVTVALCCRPKDPVTEVQAQFRPILERRADIFESTGWVLLPAPDPKFGPGAVFQLREQGAPLWLGDLVADCRVPNEVLQPVVGATPPFDMSRNVEYGASAAIELSGVEASTAFNQVRGVSFKAEDHGADAFSVLRFKNWLSSPEASIPEGCMETLGQTDTYIVREAYRVSRGRYSLKASSGASLKFDGVKASDYLTIDPQARVKVADDGSLEFDQPVYVAVRRLRYNDGSLETLSAPSSEDRAADERLLRALERY